MNLLSNHGDAFTARIKDKDCSGFISVYDGRVFLCNKEIGSHVIPENFGHEKCWNVREGTPKALEIEDVKFFEIYRCLKDGEFFTFTHYDIKLTGRVTIEDGNVYLCQNVKSGCNCRDKKGYPHSYVLGNSPISRSFAGDYFKDFSVISRKYFLELESKRKMIRLKESLNEPTKDPIAVKEEFIHFKKIKKFII